MEKTYRFRLPEGFSALRREVGDIICRSRLRSAEFGRIPKKQFAHRIGISRETLSRIENGKQSPSYATLMKIMSLLPLEWSDIAMAGESSLKGIPDYPDQCAQLGDALRDGRRTKKLKLRQLAEHTGVSFSQLSRIERGLFQRGRYIEVVFYDGVEEFDEDTIVRFTHPVLTYLAELGGYDSDIGRRVHHD